MSQKLFKNTGRETIKGGVLHALKDAGNAGVYDFAILTLTGVVVDQEIFTLSNDVYEINPILTDTGSEILAAGGVNATATSFIFDVSPTIPLLPGDVLRMETEFMIVVDANVNGTGSANVIRGAFGSVAAAHSKINSDTFQAAQPVAAGRFAVPVSAVAAATADGQIIAAVNFWTDGGYDKGLGGGIGVTVENSLKVVATQGAGTTVVFGKEADGSAGGANSEGFTSGTIDAAFGGGQEPAAVRSSVHYSVRGDGADFSIFSPFELGVGEQLNAYVEVFDSTGAHKEAVGVSSLSTATVTGRLVTIANVATLWVATDFVKVTLFVS